MGSSSVFSDFRTPRLEDKGPDGVFFGSENISKLGKTLDKIFIKEPEKFKRNDKIKSSFLASIKTERKSSSREYKNKFEDSSERKLRISCNKYFAADVNSPEILELEKRGGGIISPSSFQQSRNQVSVSMDKSNTRFSQFRRQSND